jgi:general secretion pathway protein G
MSTSMKPRRDGGFSLIELMVVVLIMGLLATTIMLSLAPVGDQSRVTKARTDIAALDSALEMYSLDMAGYPAADAGLAVLKAPLPGAADNGAYRPGGYIKRLREDPWGQAYVYAVPGARSGTSYDLYSAGPDGVAGNADDIGNWQ